MKEKIALPFGYPAESITNPTSPQVKAERGETREANTSASSSTGAHRGPRISERQLRGINNQLSNRDRAVLASVEKYRFLTAQHLEALHFTDHASPESAARTCRRVLARLRNHRVLGVLDRRIGGVRAGSEGLVYFMDTAGERLQRGSQSGMKRRRFDEPSARFLDHTLAIADAAVELMRGAATAGAEVVCCEPETAARRHYTDRLGAVQVLRPDLYIEVAAWPGDEDVEAFFIEVDLGHESLPTLVGKCLAYEDYRANGIEQREHGGFPRVVWAMDAYRLAIAERRRQALQLALEQNPKITTGLYRVLPLEDTAAALIPEVNHG